MVIVVPTLPPRQERGGDGSSSSVVAAVISKFGDDIAERYLAHQAVESKRAMKKYMDCCADLGYRPVGARGVKKIEKRYDAAIARYSDTFKSDYGWAALGDILLTQKSTGRDRNDSNAIPSAPTSSLR